MQTTELVTATEGTRRTRGRQAPTRRCAGLFDLPPKGEARLDRLPMIRAGAGSGWLAADLLAPYRHYRGRLTVAGAALALSALGLPRRGLAALAAGSLLLSRRSALLRARA